MVIYSWNKRRPRRWEQRFIPKLGKHMGAWHGIGGLWVIEPCGH